MKCESTADQRTVGSVEKGGTVPRDLPSTDRVELKLKEFFWSSPDDALSVFRCASNDRCPGGYPGEACAGALDGRACAHCPGGSIWVGDECAECAPYERAKILFPIIPLLLGPCIVVVLYKMFGDTYRRWGSPQN